MPGRSVSNGGGYRYGFNGKENDSEVKGEGGQQDYGMRIYDPRVGRFLSVDPISKDYPELTPYQFASNTPIQAIDLDGLEAAVDSRYNANLNLLKKGYISLREYNETPGAMAAGGIAGSLFAADFMTGGNVTRTTFQVLTTAQIGSLFYHNKTTSPEQTKERQRENLQNLADLSLILIGGKIIKGLTIPSKILYNFGAKALGEMGEEALARQYGTFKPAGKGSSLSTSFGLRKADGIPLGTTINSTDKLFEAKVGFQNYSGNVITEVEKDAELLATGQVSEIKWVFYRSPTTGRVGASDALLNELKKAGIKTEVAGEIPTDIIKKTVKKYGATRR